MATASRGAFVAYRVHVMYRKGTPQPHRLAKGTNMQDKSIKGITHHAYESMAEFIDWQDTNRLHKSNDCFYESFYGVDSFDTAVSRARAGLPSEGLKELDASKALTDAAVRQISAIDMTSVFDTAGAYVDMGRYVMGEPECMVDPVIMTVPVHRPVVTLVCNIAASGGVAASELRKKGRLVCALVKAIETSGRATELFVDFTSSNSWSKATKHFRASVKLKGAGQPLDMGAVLYAFSDPSMLRVHMFNAMHRMPENLHGTFGVGSFYAYPTEGAVRTAETYGDDAVYLSSVRLGQNAEGTVTRVLKELGIA